MIRVAKRDNSIVDFNLDKIKGAISQAFDATNKVYDDQIIELIALRSTANFNSKIVPYSLLLSLKAVNPPSLNKFGFTASNYWISYLITAVDKISLILCHLAVLLPKESLKPISPLELVIL